MSRTGSSYQSRALAAQLTKRASMGGDSETRTPERSGRCDWASRRGLLASWREASSRSIDHFQQVRAAAPLTRRAESSWSDYLAPQTGFEPPTCWLTTGAYSRCDLVRSERLLRKLPPD